MTFLPAKALQHKRLPNPLLQLPSTALSPGHVTGGSTDKHNSSRGGCMQLNLDRSTVAQLVKKGGALMESKRQFPY